MSTSQMLINYVPGEECRVAIVEDGKLEEYHAEPTTQISRVNNIYVGRVKNVESSIQAAFVDFGLKEAGFLHVSDLHPMYFPGEDDDTTERVGKKTPRRERPPIQQCLRKGQEIVVQVLKEGVGTKGPTVTSYISIPGRFLVMMPQMDKVGVSRKVEDEEQRKQMRDILAQLELPEGFGFILRTAGFDRNKTELKRDLAYLMRLWKDMEKRRTGGTGPRLLYSESDLLVRAIRDWLTSDIQQVVIDHPSALARAGRFMKIVAPRGQIKLMRYAGDAPMFHAFGIEEQVLAMHAREVPLPSGGRLVIDETEALVAIDVNSGKSRSARDAETNAFQTNLEAVDEICRQLRLRDLGGLVISDLIDMRSSVNRRKVEQRMRERLKRDRARSTTLAISEFGILEMTRQRQRSSHERAHFVECPTCRGRGLVQKPTSVAGDALRELGCILAHKSVHRAELVVSPRLAGELLSMRRLSITRLERAMGKHVDVRVSEAIPIDRFTIYAYEESGADLNVDKIRGQKLKAEIEPWEPDGAQWAEAIADDGEAPLDLDEPEVLAPELTLPLAEDDDEAVGEGASDAGAESAGSGEGGKKKRRRRRRRRKDDAAPDAREGSEARDGVPQEARDEDEPASEGDGDERAEVEPAGSSPDGEDRPKGKRRRRRRGRRRDDGALTGDAREPGTVSTDASSPAEPALRDDDLERSASADGQIAEAPAGESSDSAPAKKKRRRRKPAKPSADGTVAPPTPRTPGGDTGPLERAPARPRKVATPARGAPPAPPPRATGAVPETLKPSPEPKPVRSLYGASRRRLSPSERTKRPSER